MRAARLHAPSDLRVRAEPDPADPPPGWAIVRMTSVGICGSDLHWFTDGGIGENRIDAPVVPGHELAGVAVTGVNAGRRVAVDPAIPCGHCESCAAGHANLCPYVRFAGHGDLDGGMQELLVWPDRLLVPLPDGVSDDAGAMLEPLGVAIHAVDHAHVAPGADVLVVGAGPIGALCVAVARAAGAGRVFATDPLEHRRRTAMAFGADHVWAPADAAAALAESTVGRGVDVVVECAGGDTAVRASVDSARPGARIVLAGIPDDDAICFTASVARRKGLTFSMARRMHDTYGRAIALATTGLDLDALVSDRFPLERAADAFAHAAARNGDKTVVRVGE